MKTQSNLPQPDHPIPNSLWVAVRLGFVGLVTAIGLATVAVALGIADPKPVGRLKWEDHFELGERWQTFGQAAAWGTSGFVFAPGQNEIAGAVIDSEGADYTFEVAGGQTAGEVGAAFGIVFGYQSPTSYTAVLINGNSYIEVISAEGQPWLAWQQWPNIQLGYEANRVRVDVVRGEGVIRINDEVLLTLPVTAGKVGLIARGSAADQRVRFGWAKLWGK